MSFRAFKRYLSADGAADMVAVLQAHAVPYELEGDQQPGDGMLMFGQSRPVVLKLRPADFDRARALLRDHLAPAVAEVGPGDHYLFDFADDELREIVAKPDEWGDFDYLLAQRLLRERGHDLPPARVRQLAANRQRDLADPETAPLWVVVLGYGLALLGGLFGTLTGWYLANHHTILPNGQRVPAFDDDSRAHGRRILLLGGVVWVVVLGRWVLRLTGG